MKYRLIILILLIGAVLAGIWLYRNDDQPPAPTPTIATLPPRAAAIAQLPGRPVDYSRGAIVRVEVVFEDGTTKVVLPGVVVATATPIPTDTSHATATASATATSTPPIAATWTPTDTYTPPPTNTPRPTATEAIVPSATATHTPYPTPTQETTSIPTVTATTPIKTCSLRSTTVLRVRSGAGVQYGQIDNWYTGDEKTFTEFAYDGAMMYLWGHHSTGWSAVFYNVDGSGYYVGEWWVAGGEGAELCRDVQGWPENLAPPEPFAGEWWEGFHTLTGGDGSASVLLNPAYVGKYTLIKCLDGGFSLCQQAKAANPEIVTIYRTYQHDCPPAWWEGNSEAWWSYIEGQLPIGADFYEIQNECDPPLARAGAWAQAMIEMALIVERERGASLLAFSSGPGNPDLPYWRELWPYINWVTERNKLAGTQHGIATHSSAYAPVSIDLPVGSWINNLYISGREKIVCDMAAANDYGALCGGFVWINTELGWGDGYQGNKDEFSCYEQGLMYRETIRRKTEDGINGFALWNVGQVGAWMSVANCMSEILG